MKTFNLLKVFSLPILGLINTASAADPTTVTFLTDDMEFGLELIIASLAVVAAIIAIKVRNDVKGGQLESSFNYFALASISFAILEIYQIIKGLWFKITGLGDIIELVFVLLLIMGFYKAKEALQ